MTDKNNKQSPQGRPKNIPNNPKGHVRGSVPTFQNPPPPPPRPPKEQKPNKKD